MTQLQDSKTAEVLGVGKVVGTLYVFYVANFLSRSLPLAALHVHHLHSLCTDSSTPNKDSISVELWHRHFGHASAGALKHLPFLSSIVFPDLSQCDVCPIAKQSKQPFPSSSIHTGAPFELIYVDLWGPYNRECHTNSRFVVTIVDDVTRATWTHLISHNSQTLTIFTIFLKMVTVHFHTTVGTLRSDNGTEFRSTAFQDLLIRYGIAHQRTCVYTPQQNGVIERKRRHLLQLARALLFQAHLPKYFRDHAIRMNTYLINRLPSSLIDWKSLYDLLYKRHPDCSTLRCFGCLCFAINTEPHKDKFAPKALKCIFLGFQSGFKAYKLFSLESHVIFFSRDVIFHENVFPYPSSPFHSPSPSLPLPSSDTTSPLHFQSSPSLHSSPSHAFLSFPCCSINVFISFPCSVSPAQNSSASSLVA